MNSDCIYPIYEMNLSWRDKGQYGNNGNTAIATNDFQNPGLLEADR